MKLIRGLYNLQASHKGSIATIGNFDGVHLGHLSVIKQLRDQAQRLNCQTTVITFEPLPHEFFMQQDSPARLTPLCEKVARLKDAGIDQVLCLRFNQSLSQLSADAFIKQVLIDGLGITQLVIGDDFRFGKDRKGDFKLLQSAGYKYGFEVLDTQTFLCSAASRISSTRIRRALAHGDFVTVKQLLSRDFTMSGRVIHGDKRGRTIGFPTMNIPANRPVSPLHGVFVVEVEGLGFGVANIGTRPTFNGKGYLAEIHLLDFQRNLYGQRINVRWLKKLRAEKRFDSFNQLVEQINHDIEAAREAIKHEFSN